MDGDSIKYLILDILRSFRQVANLLPKHTIDIRQEPHVLLLRIVRLRDSDKAG